MNDKISGLTRAYIVKPGNHENRNDNEYYPTPAIATLSLLKNYDVPKRLWEPAAGRGHISKELIRNGHDVVSTDLFEHPNPFVDIETGVDFLTADKRDVDGVITNPPFRHNLPEKLIIRMMEELGYEFLALFIRVTFLESERRFNLFKRLPPTKVLILSNRINCNEKYFDKNDGLGGMVAYAWMVWDKRTSETNMIDWIRSVDYIGELEYNV